MPTGMQCRRFARPVRRRGVGTWKMGLANMHSPCLRSDRLGALAVAEVAEGFATLFGYLVICVEEPKSCENPYVEIPAVTSRVTQIVGKKWAGRVQGGFYSPPGSRVLRSPTATPPAGRSAGCRRSWGPQHPVLVTEQGGSLTGVLSVELPGIEPVSAPGP